MLMYHTFDSDILEKFYAVIRDEKPTEPFQSSTFHWLQKLLDCFVFDRAYAGCFIDYRVVVVDYLNGFKRVCLEHDMPQPRLDAGMLKLTDLLEQMFLTNEFYEFAKANGCLMGLQTLDKSDHEKLNRLWAVDNRVQVLMELHKRQGYVNNWAAAQEVLT
jgi:hypothetical protein